MELEHHHHLMFTDESLTKENTMNSQTHTVRAEIINHHYRTCVKTTTEDEDEDHILISNDKESFPSLDKDIPKSDDTTEKKLQWLRSQIIGLTAEFNSSFGIRRLTYADHTASGRSLHFIESYISTYVLPFYGNSHTSDSYVGYRTTKMVREASNYVKKCLGGGPQDSIVFCGSGSTAAIKRLQEVMGISIPSILRERVLISEKERWVVFVGPYEHHSNILSWRQSLAEVVEIGLDKNGLINTEELIKKLKYYKLSNRPILGSFSACSNVTGISTDTRAIARIIHWFGGFVCYDFAASGPYVKIDMRSGEIDGFDAIFLSTHKFLGGPASPGILLMSNSLYRLGTLPPSTCGGGTVDFVNSYNDKDTLYVENIEDREDAGTPQIIQKIRAALAFWIKEYIGYEAIEKLETSYITRALKRLLPNPNIQILGNTTEHRQAILSFLVYSTRIPSSQEIVDDSKEVKLGLDLWRETGEIVDKPLHGPFVAKLLNDLFGIQARGGCACAGPYGHSLLNVDETKSLAFRSAIKKGYAGVKPGWTRVSFPYYMSEEEFEFILVAIEFIAIYGQRFLPLYHFSWRSGAWTFKKTAVGDGLSNVLSGLSALRSMIKEEDALHQFAGYLESARHIARFLPKLPAKRKIPEDIDIDHVPFRV